MTGDQTCQATGGCVARLEGGSPWTAHRVRFTIGQLMIAVAADEVVLVWRDLRVTFA